jgi:hypothetical protein
MSAGEGVTDGARTRDLRSHNPAKGVAVCSSKWQNRIPRSNRSAGYNQQQRAKGSRWCTRGVLTELSSYHFRRDGQTSAVHEEFAAETFFEVLRHGVSKKFAPDSLQWHHALVVEGANPSSV